MIPQLRKFRAALALGTLLFAAACDTHAPAPISVLFVTIDTLRPGHLGVYGHPDARTPHIDALARGGATFADVRVPYPLTLPSHSTLFTGRLPYRHGARRNDSFAFDPDLPTLAGQFAASGAATGAVISTFVLNRNFGLGEAFGTYNDLAEAGGAQHARNERRADEVSDVATAWLAERPDSTFFYWAHYFDPHEDYEPPRPFSKLYGATEMTLYDGEIAYTDIEFGRLLRALEERRQDVLVVLTSDHGEALGEHGEWGHGYFLYDTTVRVPLIFAGAGRDAGAVAGAEAVSAAPQQRVHSTFVHSLDVFPTICRLTAVKAPADLPGRFLDPFAAGPPPPEPLYLETFEPRGAYGATELRAIVADDWKWIESPIPELYALYEDGQEVNNLESSEPEREEMLQEILARHRRAEAVAGRNPDAGPDVGDEVRDRLAALGYLGAGPGEEDGAWARRDPKEIVALIPKMFEGIKHCRNNRWEEGVAVLHEVLREDPINGKALHWISEARLRSGDGEGAVELLREALEHDPMNTALLNQLGVVGMRAKQPQTAIDALEVVVRVDPQHVSGWLNLASARAQRRDIDGARQAVQSALDIDPHNPVANQLGRRLGLIQGDGPPGPGGKAGRR